MNRRLSLPEHMMCLASDTIPINFVLTARIDGDVSVMQIRQALAGLRQKHPLLAVGVMDGDNGRFYFTNENIPDFSIRLVARDSDATWEREVEQELVEKFDWRAGPLLRFVLIQGTPISELLVVCHHAAADGLSAMYLIHDLLELVDDPETPITPLPLLQAAERLVPAAIEKKPAMLFKTTTARVMLKLLPLFRLFRKQAAPEVPEEKPDLRFQMMSWTLDLEETTAVISRAKQEETTVHAALGAAFLKAFARLEGEATGWEREVSSPVSIRQRLEPPVGEAFGLFMTLVEVKADCAPERDFWEIAREIKQKLVTGSTDDKVFLRFLMAKHIHPNMADKEISEDFTNIAYDLSITNLGRFDFPTTYGEFQLKAIWGPVVTTMNNERILGVITVGGQLCFTFVFQPKDITPEYAEQIRANAMQSLREACG